MKGEIRMPGTRWPIWQVNLLNDLLAQGLSPSEMKIASRTPTAIHNKAVRLGLIGMVFHVALGQRHMRKRYGVSFYKAGRPAVS